MPQKLIRHEAEVTDANIVVDWCNFMREECMTWYERNQQPVGGFDANGEETIAEIDETKFFHRKYHRGQWREGHWIFGGNERGTGRCFLVPPVDDRHAATLSPLIEEHILPGTRIVSDAWRAYMETFLVSDRVCTHIRLLFINLALVFNSYLYDFQYRHNRRQSDIFSEFMVTLAKNYA